MQHTETLSGELEKHQKIFDWLAWWELDGDTKKSIADLIIGDLNTGIEYRSQMILSAMIAALGLLTNSTAVVIGAMLIAPILRPIQGLAFSTATGNHRMFMQALVLLLSSVAGGVGIGALIAWMMPFVQTTTEIAARIQPTILDLFVAMASGMIAFLALGYKKIASSLAGVAMAAALVPPLAVMGIGVAMMDRSIVSGSSILFATNLVAIVIVGVIVLFLFGFSPNAKKSYLASRWRVVLIVILLCSLAIPLMQSLSHISQDISIKNIIRQSTQSYLHTIDGRIMLTTSTYQHVSSDTIDVTLGLQVPQSIVLTQDEKLELTQLLASKLDKGVSVQILITPTIAVQKPTENEPTIHERLEKNLTEYLQTTKQNITYITSTYVDATKIYAITLYAGSQVDTQQYENKIKKQLATYDLGAIVIDWRQEKIKKTTQETTLIDQKLVNMRQSLQVMMGEDVGVQHITYDEKIPQITIEIVTYQDQDIINKKLQTRKTQTEKKYGRTNLSLIVDIQKREKIRM